MTDDPNPKQNESGYPAKQSGQSQPNHLDDQQRKGNQDDVAQKRPTQGGRDVEDDQQRQDQGGQRKAS